MDVTLDLGALLAALGTTGALSVAAAQYLSGKLIDHRLSKDLKDYDAALRKELEDYLGDRAAERSYRAEARKRLYLAVGPLRFQLLVAAAELANRVARLGDGKYSYDMSLTTYFGQSTAYRLLRVLAVSELIERQVAFADFGVDPEIRVLLRFKRQAFLCLSSHRVSLGHPQEDWNTQRQHVFYDVLGIIASSLIVQDAPAAPPRVMRFDEFAHMLAEPGGPDRIQPIPRLLTGFRVPAMPVLWLRLVALAGLCTALLQRQGADLGLELDPLDVEGLLRQGQDPHVIDHLARYQAALAGLSAAIGDAPA